MRLGLAIGLAVALAVSGARPSLAKELKFSTPGRNLYGGNETFGAVLDQGMRTHVIEVAMGTGPEGNLGAIVGWLLNKPEGLEFYAGFGVRIAPAYHYTLSARYFVPIGGYHYYIGGGYLLQRISSLGIHSHSGFAEVGHKWIIRRTYHVTLSLGYQRIVSRVVEDDSLLHGPRIDPALLERELDAVSANRYLACLRFSRAF